MIEPVCASFVRARACECNFLYACVCVQACSRQFVVCRILSNTSYALARRARMQSSICVVCHTLLGTCHASSTSSTRVCTFAIVCLFDLSCLHRDVSRTFNILDAPSGELATEALRQNRAKILRASPRGPSQQASSQPTSPANLRSTLRGGPFSVPNTPLGDETSRFARGFVTPRRMQATAHIAGSAAFMPSLTNISMAVRPKTGDSLRPFTER